MAPADIEPADKPTTPIEESWSENRDHHQRRSSRSRSPAPNKEDKSDNINQGSNLHVSGLSRRVESRDLEEHFSRVGQVVKASVMYDPHTHESRGFAFVEMNTAEEAQAAITTLNATDLLGKAITVTKARRGRARTPTPGRYHGPPKKFDSEHPYRPRPYDRYREDDYRRRRDNYDDRRRGGRGRYEDDYRRGDRYDDGYNYRRDRERDEYDRARR